jgi:photosystem II stability/assembly factor-like uncharacterized protein
MKSLLSTAIIFCGLFTAINSAVAQSWTPTSAPSKNWVAVASSIDGSKLIAGSLGWIYCLSTNSGMTWITNTQPQKGSAYGSWSSIASSADGTKLVGILANVIWVSTNSGNNWLSNNVSGGSFFASVAMSADGSTLATVDEEAGSIYTSTNSGLTWMQTIAPSNDWLCIASSADGTKLVAGNESISGSSGFIYASTNSGLTWMPTGAPTNEVWRSIASSADGSILIAGSAEFIPSLTYGGVYTSTNFGMTWTSNNVPNAQWQSVASSADGTKLIAVAVEPSGLIYRSTNSGTTWILNNTPPNKSWNSVASSADGDKLVAAPLGDQSFNPAPIYTLQITPVPQLNLTLLSDNLALSWIVPSTNFVLQQNCDLSPANWVTLTNAPTLNFTNLQNQVMLSITNASGFFRLITQ